MALQGLGSRRNTVYKPTHPSFARAFRLRSVWTPPHWLKQRLLIDVPSIRGVISVGFLRDNKNTYVIVPIFWEVAHGTAYISCFVVKCTALTIPWVVVEDRIVPLDLFFHLLLRFSRTKLRGAFFPSFWVASWNAALYSLSESWQRKRCCLCGSAELHNDLRIQQQL